MPRIPAERSYDDITYKAGDNRVNASGSFSPFTFLCITLVLTLLGLVVLYSASYTKAISLGYPHYHYFALQSISAAVAVIAGVFISMLPSRLIAKGWTVLLPLSILAMILTFVPGFFFGGMLRVMGVPVVQPGSLAILATVFVISSLLSFSKDEREARHVVAASVFLIVIELLVLFSCGVSWFTINSLIILLMLRRCRVLRSAVVLTLLFMLVTGVAASIIFPYLLSPVLSSVLPVTDSSLYDQALIASRNAIADGGIAGAGLGSGLYKLGELTSPESQFIFAVFSEELGIVGAAFLLILFILYLVIGIRTSSRSLEKEDGVTASLSYGLSLMIALKALFDMLYVLGVLPLSGIMLPFFSYSVSEEAITMLSSAVLYRLVYRMGREHES